jgi:hypothetical protein
LSIGRLTAIGSIVLMFTADHLVFADAPADAIDGDGRI